LTPNRNSSPAKSFPNRHPNPPLPDIPTRVETRPWEWALLAAIVLLGAIFRLWNLGQNGFGNPYYASAVRSMLMKWHNFFFVSFDPTGWVTVDKPPVSLWIQTLSAYLLGYKGFSLILPQVLEGLGSVVLVWALVRRRFDAWAALFAGLVMALSPVSVAVDRFNNTDACLVLVLLVAAWFLVRAIESANQWYLMAALALMGIAFNTKMMAAFVVLPAFYSTYLLGAPASWGRRLAHLTYGSLILALVALSWPLAVDLTPPEQRPFVGSTQENSMISLSLGWNGFQRLMRGRGRGAFPGAQPTPAANGAVSGVNTSATTKLTLQDTAPNPNFRRNGGRNRGRGNFMGSGEPGPFRLADKNMAGQIAWFLPLAMVALLIGWRMMPTRFPLPPVRQNLFLWAGWLACYGAVFSFMRGAMHPYYLVLMVPPLAALSGIGIRALWVEYQSGNRSHLPLALLLTATWQAFIVAQFPDWQVFLLPILLVGSAALAVGLALVQALRQGVIKDFRSQALLVAGLLVLFICPTIWALSPVLGSGRSVEANPDLFLGDTNGMFGRGGGDSMGQNTNRLTAFLKANRHGEKYLVAAQNSQAVAPIIIQTGEPAIALGGFMGGDPIVTAHEFAQMVKDGQIRYFLMQGFGGPGGMMGQNGNPDFRQGALNAPFGNRTVPQAEIAQWVRENGVPVDPKLWSSVTPNQATPGPGTGGFRRGTPVLYDLNPDKNGNPS
jgi:4-amino-4-deoxy-L-arabinose transferase-like glycosyltransferase